MDAVRLLRENSVFAQIHMRTTPLLRISTALSRFSTRAFATTNPIMSSEAYTPPTVWKWEPEEGSNRFASINQPTAGARAQKELPVGKHPLQLYSLATPNGQKVTIMLEELLAAGKDAEYDAWTINIMDQDQFGSDFVAINPNSKIPAMKDGDTRLFESGSILLHLAEKFDAFLPAAQRTEVLNWLFWQMGSAPYVGGGFGHFFKYAAVKQQYPIDRFTMETKRQLDVLEKQLASNKFICGDEYTVADIAIYPWYGRLAEGKIYDEASAIFLNAAEDYPNVLRWSKEIGERPAVKRGLAVNRVWGDEPQLKERHSAADLDALDL